MKSVIIIVCGLFTLCCHAQFLSGVNVSGANLSYTNAVEIIPTNGLFIKYAMNEGSGQRLANSVYSDTIVNLIGPSEQNFSRNTFWSVSSAVTDAYSNNPNGIQTASRINWAASGLKQANTAVNAPPGNYVLTVWAMSNTGGFPKFRFEYNDGSLHLSSDRAITGTWLRYTNAFTSSGTIATVGLANDSTSGAVDMSIWGIQLEPGTVATDYSSHWNGVLGLKVGTDSADPSWTANSTLDFAGAVKYTYGIGDPVTLSTCSFYSLVKWTSIPQSVGFGPIMTAQQATSADRLIGLNGDTIKQTNNPVRVFFGGGGINALNTYSEIPLTNWAVAAMVYDGTNILGYIDDQLAAQTNYPGHSVSMDILFQSDWNFSQNWPGEIGYFLAYTNAHTSDQVAQVVRALQVQADLKGLSLNTAKKFVLFEGDSITGGLGVVNSYAYLAAMSNSVPHLNSVNTAQGGRRLEAANGGVPSVTNQMSSDNLYLSVNPKTKVLSLQIGANDLGAGLYADGHAYKAAIKNYCLMQRTNGWKICIGTVLANSSSTVTNFGGQCNADIRADPSFYDALADYDTTPLAVGGGNAGNTTYFQDGVHPTQYGATLMAPVVAAAIASIP